MLLQEQRMMPAVPSHVETTAREQVKEFIFILKFESEILKL